MSESGFMLLWQPVERPLADRKCQLSRDCPSGDSARIRVNERRRLNSGWPNRKRKRACSVEEKIRGSR